MKKFIGFLIALLYLIVFNVSFASVAINEIMYDLEGSDSGREWIEVYNSGSSSVDLSSYKFFESGTNHGLVLEQGDESLPSGGYAVIVSDKSKFMNDWPLYSGAIFDSSFSLDNTGEFLAIKDASLNISSEYTYDSALGGAGDGNSLQKVGGVWFEATPTPGAQNSGSGGIVNEEDEEDGEGDNQDVASSNSSYTPSKPVRVSILKEGFAYIKQPVKFSSEILGSRDQKVYYGKLFWNFGDGSAEEVLLTGGTSSLLHTYEYEGEYLVTLQYFLNQYDTVPKAYDEVWVKVRPLSVVISKVGETGNFFIELHNESEYDIEISDWRLLSFNKIFILPENTILKTGRKIVLPSSVTGFDFDDKNSLKLYGFEGELVFDFGETLPKPKEKIISYVSSKKKDSYPSSVGVLQNPISSEEVSYANESALESNLPEFFKNTDTGFNFESGLSSGAINSFENNEAGSAFKYILFMISVVILASFSVYFVRKNNQQNDSEEMSKNSDFELF